MSTANEFHYGTPPADFLSGLIEERITLNVHDFANLPSAKGKYIYKDFKEEAGLDHMFIYPGGCLGATDGMISVHLVAVRPADLSANYSIAVTIKSHCGEKLQKTKQFRQYINPRGLGFKFDDYAKRDDILDESKGLLNNGTLSLVVRITPFHPSKPRPSLHDNIYEKLFLDEESADVAFKVKGSTIYAHKSILKAQASEFLELVQPFNKVTHMPIDDVDADVFKVMLKHVYGQNILTNEWREHSKVILEASGKYGFTHLKIEAEDWLVKNSELTVDNAIAELLYADGIHCILLKKTVMEFIMENGEAIMESLTYQRLSESPKLMKEVMIQFAKSLKANKKRKLGSD